MSANTDISCHVLVVLNSRIIRVFALLQRIWPTDLVRPDSCHIVANRAMYNDI